MRRMKVSFYNHFTNSFAANHYIAFNALTGAHIELDQLGFDQLEQLLEAVETHGTLPDEMSKLQEQLVSSGFVVDADSDELARVHDRYFDFVKTEKGMSLTIAPTISCNFGCNYCFQSHSNRRMRDEEINRLVHFVEERLEPNTYLAITWFGGEPLTAFGVLEKLARKLSKVAESKACAFHHSIITNGFVLNEEKARFLASIPKFGFAQITLDGTAFDHDQRRFTLAGKGTFDRIIENIKVAVAYLPIVIRVNVDKSNVDGLPELLDKLAENDLADKLSIYLGHVWDYTEEVDKSPFLTIEEFASVETQFRLSKFAKGFGLGVALPKPRRGGFCVADHPNGYVVGPSGLLFNCWNEVHEQEPKASGALPELGMPTDPLQKSEAMKTNAKMWDTYDPFTHSPCQTCKVAPMCMSGCPWESAKTSPEETGHCTALRFNLEDTLRLVQLSNSVNGLVQRWERPELHLAARATKARELGSDLK